MPSGQIASNKLQGWDGSSDWGVYSENLAWVGVVGAARGLGGGLWWVDCTFLHMHDNNDAVTPLN